MSLVRTKSLLKHRQELIDIHRHALNAIRPENLVKNSLFFSKGSLFVKSQSRLIDYDLTNTRIHVVGGGKSVMAMAIGLAESAKQSNCQSLFSHGCLSIPVGLETLGHEKSLESIGVKCHKGSKNNLPDRDSVKATDNILGAVSRACRIDQAQGCDSLFIVLISGGGSACLTSPRYVSLSKKLEMIKFLVQRGANIVELNKARRYYSKIKGGGLARHILSCNPNSRIISLILSDVIGDPLEFIASGPTFLEERPTAHLHRVQAQQVLLQYAHPVEDLPPTHGSEQVFDDDFSKVDIKSRISNQIIGNNEIAVGAAILKAQSLGYKTVNLGSGLQGNTRSIVDELVRSAKQLFTGSKLLVIGGGEATVTRDENETWGEGGRAQEMALDYVISCLSKPHEYNETMTDVLLAGTTDGQDGPTDVGACLASHADLVWNGSRDKLRLDDALDAKTSHNSYRFLTTFKPDWLVKTGLTGTNVMDLYMYSIAKFPDIEPSKL